MIGCITFTEALHLIFLIKKPQNFYKTHIVIGCSVSPSAETLLPYFTCT